MWAGNEIAVSIWSCVQITSDITLSYHPHWPGMDRQQALLFLYIAEWAIYATLAPGMSCYNPDYYCEVIDNTNTVVGEDLKVSSWSGNRPGTVGYNPLVRERRKHRL